jgi:TolB-like protein/DNA-binding winged helix-turn-helix (wHTH) protein/tetratricopeptide (TPR) repeat protein
MVFKLLVYLIDNRDRLILRQELIDSVWCDKVISDSALDKAVARLRNALDDNAARPRYLETVYGRGYRFVAEVEETTQTVDAAAPPRADRPKSARPAVLAVMVTAVLIALSVWLWPGSQDSASPAPRRVKSLAVLPLNNLTGDQGQDYFVDGLQDILVTELSQNGNLRITSRQSTLRYRNSELTLPVIAEQLSVDALVEGSVLGVGDSVEINIQLIDGRTDEHLWAQHFERDTGHVFNLFTDVANAIGSVIDHTGVEQSAGSRTSEHSGAVDPLALSAYLKGISNLDRGTPDGVRTALEQLHRATEIEPGFSMAWSYIALTHAILGARGLAPARESFERTRAASLKAIQADDQNAMGYSGLGWSDLFTFHYQSGCELFQNALKLNPSEPYAVHGHADCLMLAGRMKESITELRKLRMLGPFTMFNNIPLCFHLFLARHYDEAIAANQEMHERFPGFSMHMQLSWLYWTQGRFEEAIDEERKELEWRKDAGALAALDAGYMAAGPVGALKSLADFLAARSNETLVDAFRIGEAYARAGFVDEAFHWLNVAVDQGSFEVIWIGFRPDFDHLRDDPRYAQLMQRIAPPANFANSWQ